MTELTKQQIETIQQDFRQHSEILTNTVLRGRTDLAQLRAHGEARQAIAEAVAKLEVLKGTVK